MRIFDARHVLLIIAIVLVVKLLSGGLSFSAVGAGSEVGMGSEKKKPSLLR